jgi:hypothetical protein
MWRNPPAIADDDDGERDREEREEERDLARRRDGQLARAQETGVSLSYFPPREEELY